jgi:Mce-associated membrane protein
MPDWAQVEPPEWDEEPDWEAAPVDAVTEPIDLAGPAEALVPAAPTEVTEPVEVTAAVDVVDPVDAGAPAEGRASDDAAGPVEPAQGSGLVLPIALALALVVLLGAVGWLVKDARDNRAHDDARQAALQAARQEAVNLTTISYETADADLGRIIAAATGTLKTQFEGQRAQFPAVLAKDKSVSVGTVLAAGVASQSASTVEALVAVDAAVSNAETAKAGGQPLVKHYRMDMKLVFVSGRWLVSQVAFAGLPQ